MFVDIRFGYDFLILRYSLSIVDSLVSDTQRVLTVLHFANLFTDMYTHVLTCKMLLCFTVKFLKNKIHKAAVLAQLYLIMLHAKMNRLRLSDSPEKVFVKPCFFLILSASIRRKVSNINFIDCYLSITKLY